MRLRFAPSPTGRLHVGNARTALFNWLAAVGAGGALVLRIEDTDEERSTHESEEGILEDLRWLGVVWDEGPDVGGPYGPYRQSERAGTYRRYADELLARGVAYHCFCSAADLESARRGAVESGRAVVYPGTCRDLSPKDVRRRLSAGESAAIRFCVPDFEQIAFEDVVRGTVSFARDVIGDPVILRSNGRPAYNFAVVVDDALMKISHVVRGEDHLSNTPRQLLLADALGFDRPVFAHLALVMGPDQAPLSKRHGATSVAQFREQGYLPEALANYLALLGWSPGDDDEILPLAELARRFRIAKVGRSSGLFDPEKLAWVNRHYLKSLAPERLVAAAIPFFRRAGRAGKLDASGRAFLGDVAQLASGDVDRLGQIPDRVRFLFEFDVAEALSRPEVQHAVADADSRRVIDALAAALAASPRLDADRFRQVKTAVRKETGCKGRALFHPIRVALTGRTAGMELDRAVPAIDRGAELDATAGVSPILGCRERVAAFAAALERSGPGDETTRGPEG